MYQLNLENIFNKFIFDNSKSLDLSNIIHDINNNFKDKILEIKLSPFYKIAFLNAKLGKYYAHEILLLEQELIQIYYYKLISDKYKKFADMGTNIGLHTLLASQIFSEVRSYEPEDKTFNMLLNNLNLNKINNVNAYKKAVSIEDGELTLIKNSENPTSNHLEISHVSDKYKSIYKDLKKTKVNSISFEKVLEQSDVIKIDIEGHEGEIFKNLDYKFLKNKILFIEIHNDKNSYEIKNFYNKNIKNIKCSLIKNGIKLINNNEDFPNQASDGSIIFECN